MKKKVRGIVTEIPVMLNSISINRRASRQRNSEVWFVDGVDTSGKEIGGVGYVTVIYREKPQEPFVCGGIESVYDLSLKEKQVWKMLADEFQFNLDVVSAECFFTWRSGTVDDGWE